jgi:hypothetical protein
MKILVAGWFSFEGCSVTGGDLMARDLACQWIESTGHSYDIALASPFIGGVNWRSVDPKTYSHVVFVCGPFACNRGNAEFVKYFSSCRLIGLDLSMIEPTDRWNPFDVLIERDSSAIARPDIAFGCDQPKIPIVGIILVHPQNEYGSKNQHHIANEAINRLINSREMVALPIDTGLDPNKTNLRTAAEIESLIARMDLVVTTRLHGTVLALKNSVPAIVIDGIAGGAKVLRQAETIGWPVAFSVDRISDEALQKAFEYCLTEDARAKAKECCDRALKTVEQVRDEFILALNSSSSSSARVCSQEALKEYDLASNSWLKLKEKVTALRYKTTGNVKQWLFRKLYRPY